METPKRRARGRGGKKPRDPTLLSEDYIKRWGGRLYVLWYVSRRRTGLSFGVFFFCIFVSCVYNYNLRRWVFAPVAFFSHMLQLVVDICEG